MGFLLTVEDVDGEENGGNFKTLVHKIDSKNSYSLCTRYSGWTYGPSELFSGFNPVEIILSIVGDGQKKF
jgi:hypothetical protein